METVVTVGFTDGKDTTSALLMMYGEPGAFVTLGWLPDEYPDAADYHAYWQAFHRITDSAFEELGARRVRIPAHRITYIREVD